MNTERQDYLDRKAAEIECLQRFAGTFEIQSAPSTHQEVIDQKLRLKSAILKANINPLWGMSNLTGNKFVECHGFNINYTYQRSGLTLENPKHLELLYQNLNFSRDYISQAFLTHCGQAAISLLFHILGSYQETFSFQTIPSEIYFETAMYLRDNNIFEIDSQSNRILFIDSSTAGRSDWANLVLEEELKLVVFDTTNYPLSSGRIAEVLNQALDRDIPCVLLRSHLKLDNLGIEYSRLGSLCLVYRSANALSDFILEKYPNALRYMGGYASPEHLYPFYLDAEFQGINNNRLSILKESNRQFFRCMSQKDLHRSSELPRIAEFDHELFCVISVQPDMEWVPFVHRLIKWTKGINDSGQPCRLVDSFAWDFIALSSFMPDGDEDRSNALLSDKVWKIRVAIPDIGASELIAFADELAGLVEELDARSRG